MDKIGMPLMLKHMGMCYSCTLQQPHTLSHAALLCFQSNFHPSDLLFHALTTD
jgi:hypothetical protein